MPNESVFRRADGRKIPARRDGEDPFIGNCKAHLRRSCGVCEHFPPALGLHATATGRCLLLSVTVRASEGAARCSDWSRRSASPSLIEKDV